MLLPSHEACVRCGVRIQGDLLSRLGDHRSGLEPDLQQVGSQGCALHKDIALRRRPQPRPATSVSHASCATKRSYKASLFRIIRMQRPVMSVAKLRRCSFALHRHQSVLLLRDWRRRTQAALRPTDSGRSAEALGRRGLRTSRLESGCTRPYWMPAPRASRSAAVAPPAAERRMPSPHMRPHLSTGSHCRLLSPEL